jgi:serine/threonine-protein kinase
MVRFGTPPPPPPGVLEQLQIGPLPPLPIPGAPVPAPIHFGPPPTLPTGAPLPGGAPMPAGATPLPGGMAPMPAGATPLPGGMASMPAAATPMPGQFGLPPPAGPTPSNPATEVTQSRSFLGALQTHRSLVGTIAVSAATATLVAVVWLAIASTAPTSPAGGATALDTTAIAPTAPAPPAQTQQTPQAPRTPAAPGTGNAAAAQASPPPGENVDASGLPAGVGYLTVSFPAAAKVYISGRYLGVANKPLQVRCGQWFVRLARPVDGAKFPEWVTSGKTVNVACQGLTQVTMTPTPGAALD